MQTDDVGLQPGNNFSVLRVSRELRNRSGIGAMFVNRSATGDLSRSGDWNRTWGTDARVGVGEHFTLAGFGARTETPGLTGRDFAYNVDSEYDDGKHRAGFEYGRTGEAFNPEVGFLEKEGGYRRMFVPLSRDDAAAEDSRLGLSRVAAARHSTRATTTSMAGCSSRRAPSRQPLGLGERLPHRHRAQGHVGRVPRAVRDLSGRHRPGRRARRSALPDEREYRSTEVDLGAAASGTSARS